jgi:hypothetical protein
MDAKPTSWQEFFDLIAKLNAAGCNATERGIAPDYFMHSGLRLRRRGSSLVGAFSPRKRRGQIQ